MRRFIERYSVIDIKHKIFVAGNHDGSVEKRLIVRKDFEEAGITYLENDMVELESFKIWGSPHTPTFGSWYFMKSRSKIGRVWDSIPEDTDIVITHGPPRGILDTTYRRGNDTELCGDRSLLKRMLMIQPKLVCFGHIHDTGDIHNAGMTQVTGINTIFSNGACCTDGKFGVLTSHGNVIPLG
jgi:Icc-related predicted phosphoesterase